MWARLPGGAIVLHAIPPIGKGQELRALSEGVNEVVTIVDTNDQGRQLVTNGHPMSSTSFMSQRYMRALAHIPLLAMDHPERALVIGFGVGNTTHAVSLHPTIRRIDVADLSENVLDHANSFGDVNQDVLADPRVAVYVNDGRQHLRMMPPASYDLITLEPPPLALSGVGALYSKEFYALARSRLKPKGYVSQWLPAYQVSQGTVFSMIRAFIDVFPMSVLLSGADTELILLGANDSSIGIDPAAIAARLVRASAAEADLRRLALATPLEIVGTFLASPERLAEVTREAVPASDDRPVQEYDMLSRARAALNAVPQALYSVDGIAAWCPACVANSRSAPLVDGLDAYLGLLSRKYANLEPADEGPGSLDDPRTSAMIETSAYLARLWPNAHSLVGVAFARRGRFREAVEEFRIQAATHPESAIAHWSLGDAQVSMGTPEGLETGLAELQRAAELDSNIAKVQADLGDALLKARRFGDAVTHFQRAIELEDRRSEVRNNLGIALASLGRLDEAIDAFREALRLQPDSASARSNLAAALARKGG
jgi:spermidine synthase